MFCKFDTLIPLILWNRCNLGLSYRGNLEKIGGSNQPAWRGLTKWLKYSGRHSNESVEASTVSALAYKHQLITNSWFGKRFAMYTAICTCEDQWSAMYMAIRRCIARSYRNHYDLFQDEAFFEAKSKWQLRPMLGEVGLTKDKHFLKVSL